MPDKDNALSFYWNVESQGAGNFEGALVFKNDLSDYHAADKDRVDGLHYVSARLLSTGNAVWEKGYFGEQDENG